LSEFPVIRYVGLLRSPVSWARVGRHTVLALEAIGANVCVAHRKGYLFDSAFEVPARLVELQRRSGEADVDLAFVHPSLYGELRAPVKVGMLTWESSVMPADWASSVEEHLDMLLVPSAFVAGAARAAGVTATPIHVVPYGVDTAMFHPDVSPFSPQALLDLKPAAIGAPMTADDLARRFVFLTVAAPHYRKGILELVAGFAQAFSGEEGVALLVKTAKLPTERRAPSRDFEITDLCERLDGLLSGTGLSVLLMDASLGDRELASLFASADAYVCASFGEGFGLALLEAKATGLPTAAPLWGGLASFCDETDTWPVAFTLEQGAQYQYHDVARAQVARPSIDSIARVVREMRTIDRTSDPRVARSLATARALTWRRCAEGVLAAVRECLDR